MKNNLYTWSKNGMKMIINTDFKKFNNQTNCISVGACICNTQYSNYIRPYNETQCNGISFKKGELQTSDLKYFNLDLLTDINGNNHFKELVKSFDHSITLHEFFVWNKNKYGELQKDIIGWLIEDNGKIIDEILCGRKYGVNYEKRYNALHYCKMIIEESWKRINERRKAVC